MSQWVRLWEDMPTDPKWRVVARKSGRSIAEVMAVFNFMMINASEWDHRGSLSGWDDEDVGAALDVDGEHITAIREAMQGKILDGSRLMGWEKRQPKREDNSTDSVKAFREKHNDLKRNETLCNADETQRNAPEEKRLDTDKKEKQDNAPKPALVRDFAKQFYEAYPKHVEPRAAEKKFEQLVKSGVDPEHIISAADRFAKAHRLAGTDKQFIPAPAVWLNKGGYDSEDLPKPAAGAVMAQAAPADAPGYYAVRETPQWMAWANHWRDTKGRYPPSDAKGGWRFDTEWPPDYTPPIARGQPEPELRSA